MYHLQNVALEMTQTYHSGSFWRQTLGIFILLYIPFESLTVACVLFSMYFYNLDPFVKIY